MDGSTHMVIRIGFKGKRVLSFRLGWPAPYADAHRNAPLARWRKCAPEQDGAGALYTFALGFAILLIFSFAACRAKADAAAPCRAAALIAGGELPAASRPPGRF
jgi:hypothetical protein